MPTLPRYEGMDRFRGRSFHTFHWPHEGVELEGKRVGIIGTGATAIQVIAEIADKVGELYVFQRRPNWSAPLNNGPISEAEMAQIRARYDEIFARCDATPGGFEHEPDRRGFWSVDREERLALWDRLYGEPGFGIWLANFREIFTDEAANAEFSEYIAERIRKRVKDPRTAETLIPRDHGFGVQRVPLETRYYEAYNRDNVHLVDLSETPIERITENGLSTSGREFELDILVYATGFDAVTGAFDRIDIHGRRGLELRECWRQGPETFLGLHGPRLPEHVHADRAAERIGIDQLSARHRDRRRLVHRPAAAHAGARHGAGRADRRGAAPLDRSRQEAVRDHADAEGPVLVHRLQLQRRGPRGRDDPLLRLQRRGAEVPCPAA